LYRNFQAFLGFNPDPVVITNSLPLSPQSSPVAESKRRKLSSSNSDAGVTEDMKVQHYVLQKKIIVQGVNSLRQQKTQVISNRAIRLVKDVNRFRLVCFKPVTYDPVTNSLVEWKSGWKDKEWKSVVRKCCQNGIDDEGKQYVKHLILYWRLYVCANGILNTISNTNLVTY
jgi:hypothetical protein